MPAQLRHGAAHTWLLDSLTEVAALSEINDVRLTTLERTPQLARAWPWMATLDLSNDADPDALLRRGPLADLVGDMRLIGMHPEVLVVPDASEPVTP